MPINTVSTRSYTFSTQLQAISHSQKTPSSPSSTIPITSVDSCAAAPPESLEADDANTITVNPHNFNYDIEIRKLEQEVATFAVKLERLGCDAHKDLRQGTKDNVLIKTLDSVLKKERDNVSKKELEKVSKDELEKSLKEELKDGLEKLLSERRAFFDSNLSTQRNGAKEALVAKLIAQWELPKTYLLAFGTGIAKVLQLSCSQDELKQKQEDMFKFYSKRSAGAVKVTDNLFLKEASLQSPVSADATRRESGASPIQPVAIRDNKQSADAANVADNRLKFSLRPPIPADVTLRELGASLIQAVAIGDNKQFLIMLERIANNPELQTALKDYVDIDFYQELRKTCDRDPKGLPDTEAYRNKLLREDGYYDEEDKCTVREKPEEQYQSKTYWTDTLDMSPRELRYYDPQPQTIEIANGHSIFRIKQGTSFAESARKASEPTSAGPSGSMFHFTLAAKLMAPYLRSQLGWDDCKTIGLRGWKNDASRVLMLTMMGYMHGVNDADHHHSMMEVIVGAKQAEKLIEACYITSKDKDAVQKALFGYKDCNLDELMKEVIQDAEYRAGLTYLPAVVVTPGETPSS